MAPTTRKNTVEFEAQVTALNGDKTVAETAQTYSIHSTIVTQWKGRLEKAAAQGFEGKGRAGEPPVDVDALYWKIGQIEMKRDFFVH